MPKNENQDCFYPYFFAEAEKSKQKLLFSTFIRLFLWNTQSYRYVLLSLCSSKAVADRTSAQTFVNAV
jgi:hypothetical protein